MPVLELTNEQAEELIKQLPLESKLKVLIDLSQAARDSLDERMAYGEAQMSRLCAERGLEFDKMTDEERISFVDDLLHED